jgi:hypothetical protein
MVVMPNGARFGWRRQTLACDRFGVRSCRHNVTDDIALSASWTLPEQKPPAAEEHDVPRLPS